MQLQKKQLAILGMAMLGLVLSGCVSTKKYKKLSADNETLKAERDQISAKAADLEKNLDQVKKEKEDLAKQNQATLAQYDQIVGQLAQEVQEGQLKVTQYKNMLTVDVAEQIFFDSGSAKLKSSGQAVLKKLGDALRQYQDKIIRIVGHTDNVPVGKNSQNLFPTNWELSVIRATNVVRFLVESAQLDPKRIIAAGQGEFNPIAPNDTPEGRKKNRRIEIMLLDKSIAEAMAQQPQ